VGEGAVWCVSKKLTAGVGKKNGLDAKRVSRLFPQIRHFRLQSGDLKLLNSSFICRLDSQKIPRILGDFGRMPLYHYDEERCRLDDSLWTKLSIDMWYKLHSII
jgi:hypothetical protein